MQRAGFRSIAASCTHARFRRAPAKSASIRTLHFAAWRGSNVSASGRPDCNGTLEPVRSRICVMSALGHASPMQRTTRASDAGQKTIHSPWSSPRALRERSYAVSEVLDTRRPAIDALIAAVRRTKGPESRHYLDEGTWDALSHVLVRRTTGEQEALIREGSANRSVYFLESGLVRVFRSEGESRLQLAVLGAGAVLGDVTFFAPALRGASVETLEPTPVWELTAQGYEALSTRAPMAALQLCRYLGAVLVSRMLSGTGRMLVT